jgi:hypothetical protein
LVADLAGFADRSGDHVIAVAAQLDLGTRSARQAPLGLGLGPGGRLGPSCPSIASDNTGVNQRGSVGQRAGLGDAAARVGQRIDRAVKPTVREVERANDYPEARIEQMKRIGVCELTIPEGYGGSPVSVPCYVEVTQELSRGWMSLAGAMLDVTAGS